MVCVYEFELFQDEGWYLALPFDMSGGTQGRTVREASEMAADWLQNEMEHRALKGIPYPEATFGNEPRQGGTILLVAVHAGLDSIRKVTGAEAARRLGVTRGRVSQMAAANLLDSFQLDGRTWITEQSVEARLAEAPKAGRPRKKRERDAVLGG